MRPLMAVAICVVLVGGVSFYMNARTTARPARGFALAVAEGRFALEITPSFAVEPDPFALTAGSGDAAPAALLVRVNGREALRVSERLDAGRPCRVDPVAGLVIGTNELWLEANPPIDPAGRSHAVRVRVLRDDAELVERTLWSAPGGRIAATVRLEVPAATTPVAEQGHGH